MTTRFSNIQKDIRRATRRHFSAEDKIRMVLDGLRDEDSIAELCRKTSPGGWQHHARRSNCQGLDRWLRDGCPEGRSCRSRPPPPCRAGPRCVQTDHATGTGLPSPRLLQVQPAPRQQHVVRYAIAYEDVLNDVLRKVLEDHQAEILSKLIIQATMSRDC